MFNFNDYLEYKDDRVLFTGHEMLAYVPRSYERYGLLKIGDTTDALAIFEFTIQDVGDHSIFLPAMISMSPSDVQFVTIGGIDYLRCLFKQGDVFLNHREVVRNSYLAYVLFNEYIQNGKIPKFIDYNTCAFIFDIVKEITKSKMNVNHATFEMIFSHLARDREDVRKFYRKTDMINPPRFLKLNDSAHATMSTTAKLIGGYLQDAINGMIVNPNNDTSSDIEDLLRN